MYSKVRLTIALLIVLAVLVTACVPAVAGTVRRGPSIQASPPVPPPTSYPTVDVPPGGTIGPFPTNTPTPIPTATHPGPGTPVPPPTATPPGPGTPAGSVGLDS